MQQNNGSYVCVNKIIAPVCVILYFDDLKFFGKTKISKIWSEIHDKCMNILQKVFSKSVISTLPLLLQQTQAK